MKVEILLTVVFLSILHGLIPSHWTPVMLMKKKYKWQFFYTFKIVSGLNFSHIISTILIGLLMALISKYVTQYFISENSIKWFSSIVLVMLGGYFIYRHYYHHHFHLYHENEVMKQKDVRRQIIALNIGMLFSPCLEITGLYFVGGMFDWAYVLIISLIYFVISFFSSIFWIFFFDKLSEKLNFHQIEHNSGLLSGISLIVSAVLIFII